MTPKKRKKDVEAAEAGIEEQDAPAVEEVDEDPLTRAERERDEAIANWQRARADYKNLNRRSLEDAVGGLTAQDVPYSVAFCDLDHFKRINDTHGHAAGDRALRQFGRVLDSTFRPGDLVGAGEAVLPRAGAGSAMLHPRPPQGRLRPQGRKHAPPR